MSCSSNRAPGGTQTAVVRMEQRISFRLTHWDVKPNVPLENRHVRSWSPSSASRFGEWANEYAHMAFPPFRELRIEYSAPAKGRKPTPPDIAAYAACWPTE